MGRNWRLIRVDLSDEIHYQKLPMEGLSGGISRVGLDPFGGCKGFVR